MARSKIDRNLLLTRKIGLRVSEPFYKKLKTWLAQSNCRTVAELARVILYKERVNWYYKNAELESVALELSGIRKELNAMGRNINQITRAFHQADSNASRNHHAERIAAEYKKVGAKVELLLATTAQISKKWLQG